MNSCCTHPRRMHHQDYQLNPKMVNCKLIIIINYYYWGQLDQSALVSLACKRLMHYCQLPAGRLIKSLVHHSQITPECTSILLVTIYMNSPQAEKSQRGENFLATPFRLILSKNACIFCFPSAKTAYHFREPKNGWKGIASYVTRFKKRFRELLQATIFQIISSDWEYM